MCIAQDHRRDQLLLPALPRQAGRVPDRPGQGHPQHRAGDRRGGQPGLPRRHALGTRSGTRKALRTKQIPTHPLSADLLRRRRRQPHPALRQRRPVQSHPEQGGPHVRRPLAHRDRPRPEAAHHGQQSHHPTRARKLNARGITFITLRARTPKLSAALHDLPAKAWTAMTIARAGGKTRRVQVIDDPTATLSSYPGTLRQIAVAGLGHDEPTILITNDLTSPAKKIVERYARRMNIEQRLAESIRSFGLDALAGAVPLNVDLDVVLTVLAHT